MKCLRLVVISALLALSIMVVPHRVQADPVACNSVYNAGASSSTTSQQVAAVAGKTIYVCAFVMTAASASTAQFVYGTGSNCGTGQTSLTNAMNIAAGGAVSIGSGSGVLFQVPAGQALCLAAGTANVTGFITYAQF